MNKRDLEELHKEIEREAISSTRMLGSVAILGIAILVTIFLFASCTIPQPISDYERNKIAWEEYMKKTNLRDTPFNELQYMCTIGYMHAMMDLELR